MVESSSSAAKIYFISVGRVRDQTMLATCKTIIAFQSGTTDQDIRDYCMTLLCRQNSAVHGTRTKSEHMGYSWHIYQDRNMICYILVTHSSLQDEVATEFLKSLSTQLYEQNSDFKKNPQSITSLDTQAKHIINELQSRFGKAQQVQTKLNVVTQTMKNNLTRIFSNQTDLNEMDFKSQDLGLSAQQFQ